MLLSEYNTDEVKADERLARAIHTIEKEFSVYIDETYNYFKFLSQIEYLQWVRKEEEKQMKKAKSRRR
jgi:hypothetical protein